MNLKEIRQEFIKRSGRYDLVVDTTNWADNGANFFIQAGQRILDSILPYRKDLSKMIVNISANQSSVRMKYVRAIDSVYVKASGESRNYLTRKAYSWLLENYGDDRGEKAAGTASFSGNPSSGDTITLDTETYTFSSSNSSSTVAIGSTYSDTIDNLVTVINTYSSVATAQRINSTDVLIVLNEVGTNGNSKDFTTTSSAISLDGSGTFGGTISGRDCQISTGTPLYFAPILTTPHPDLSLENLPSMETTDLYFGTDRYAQDGIVFMPPADKSYTMTIYAYYFSVLSNDLDTSYHSEMYPELLILAANFALEVFYRNTQGMQDWLAAMQTILQGIDKDLVKEEMVLSGNTLRG